ncbi:hypothetical protein KXV26_005860 [Aspergillus fumigatus]|nr:hypothetical protein KXX48_004682 [Aspergillus fumigatus]KAH2313955.1 hypothetical protein KXV26_005860 [Aspergillus fumigatus]KAH2465745.1 hypothetical protein KXW63_004927 [Aspergillus fumigatus]KAH3087975.1 hypothetical protein KXW78_004581 [Aspergillus fumigatus]
MDQSMKPLLSPTERPRRHLTASVISFFLPNQFRLSTILCIGALLQTILCAVLPLRYAAVPCVTVLLISVLTTIQECFQPNTNSFMADVIRGRTTAQIPGKDGTHSREPGKGSVVVFHLGIQYNHPLGVFAPHMREISNRFLAMQQDILRRKDELGLLAVQNWRGSERDSGNTTLIKYFFKDVESIHKFAHEPLHKETWTYYNQHHPGHVGIFHETFITKDGGYESMYVNCHPILLGRGEVKVNNRKDGTEEWVGTLVSADTPGLKSFKARLGRDD